MRRLMTWLLNRLGFEESFPEARGLPGSPRECGFLPEDRVRFRQYRETGGTFDEDCYDRFEER